MMLGGGMMLGVGLLTMLIVIGLPVLLAIGVAAGLWGRWGNRAGPMFTPPAPRAFTSAASPARYCSHCGQGLQAAWTRCPQCGAPIETK